MKGSSSLKSEDSALKEKSSLSCCYQHPQCPRLEADLSMNPSASLWKPLSWEALECRAFHWHWMQKLLSDIKVPLNASSLFPLPIQWLNLACIPETVDSCWKEGFFPSSPVSCFSVRPVAFGSLRPLRILFPKLPAIQGSVPSTEKDAEMWESSSPQTVSQSVTWMGDTQQNCEGHRKLSRKPVNSSSPVLGKFFPSPDPGFLFCAVEMSGPMITSFPSCFETSILSDQ